MPAERPEAESLDVAIAWLGRRIADMAVAPGGPPGSTATAMKSAANAVAATASPAAAAAAPSGVGAAPGVQSAASGRPTPQLDALGRDLTALAKDGMLAPAIGRDTETARLVEALCRPTRPSAVLLGPDGIGKEAIVEGLAAQIAAGSVPAPLHGCRVIELPLSGLLAGTQYRGQLEERLAAIAKEASQPGVILFVEGLDQLATAGRTEGGISALDTLRGALTRGDIRLIGTAEADAYRDAAERSSLTTLFTEIPVAELDKSATRPILKAVRDQLAAGNGVWVTDAAIDVLLDFADAQILGRRFPDKGVDLLSEAIAAAIVAGKSEVDVAAAMVVTATWSARSSSTPTLERLGRDLVGLARAGKLGPIVGRDREIDALIGVLLRRTKRNPALIGPAGSGKTAIVEGLAIRIAGGGVPEALRDTRLFDIPLLALSAAADRSPRVVEDMLAEARHPSVVLFFDEIHTLALPAVHDLAERLKPPLARGDIAVVGATTAEEYQQLVEPLSALARRFTVVPVEPLDAAGVLVVLDAVRGSLAKLRGITVTDAALDELMDLADRFLPNRAQPDKGVDLVEQAVTWALTHGRTSVDVDGARSAVAALVGMPLDPAGALASIALDLGRQSLLDNDAASALIRRLSVSLRGLDARREQADAVVLLRGAAAGASDGLADMLASGLFGHETARIDIDLAGLTEDASISSLLGSAPGLVGSDRTLPLHALRRTPWQVVVFRSVERCAVSIRDTIAGALHAGRFTDAMGRSIPLGAAIIIMTAPTLDGDVPEPLLAAALGSDLIDACDVVAGSAERAGGGDRALWVRTRLLDPLATRLARAGYPAIVTDNLVAWVVGAMPSDGTPPDRWLDRSVTPRLLSRLPAAHGPVTLDANEDGPILVVVAGPTEVASSGG